MNPVKDDPMDDCDVRRAAEATVWLFSVSPNFNEGEPASELRCIGAGGGSNEDQMDPRQSAIRILLAVVFACTAHLAINPLSAETVGSYSNIADRLTRDRTCRCFRRRGYYTASGGNSLA